MDKGENLYYNIRAGLASKPNLVPISEKLDKFLTNKDKDYYISLYRYNEQHKAILEEKGTLSGIKDTVTNNLYFDFDSKNNLDQARMDALEVANRLIGLGFDEDNIGVYFTGSKGFSVEVETEDYINADQFKAVVFNVAEGLETFDGVVNDPNRIVRIPNTKHQTTGLYKIPLTPEELVTLSIDEIKFLAKNPRQNRMLTVAKLPQILKDIEVKVEEKSIEKIQQELTFDISSIDMKSRPKGIDEARFLLMNGFFKSGERNHSMLCLASTLHNLNYPFEVTRGMLNGAAELQAARTGESQFPEREVELIINQVYSPNWRGGQFTTRDPNNWLAQYVKKMGLNIKEDNGPVTMDDIEAGFTRFIMNIEKNTIKTGIESLDKTIPITVGSNIGIVAAPGAGKTALALNILRYNSEQGLPTVFASLDMHRNRLFEKVIYNVSGIPREEVYAIFKRGEGKKLTDLVKKHYGNVWFYDRSSATIEDIRNYTLDVEQKTGQKVKMVMLDYFERINSDVSDDTASSKKVAGQIQDMVNDLDIAAITLCQPNKFSLGGGPDTEIKSYTAIKGSSFLYQSFRGIITLSRPFYTPSTKELDKYMIMNVVKNDLGELDRLKFGWHGKTGSIFQLEDHELEEFDSLLKMKDANKEDKNNNGWE